MRQHRLPIPIFLILTWLPASLASAESAREILDRATALEDGERRWQDRTQRLTLHTTDANGDQRQRQIHVFTKRGSQRGAADEDKNLSFLLAPPEVKGTGFLQWSHPGRDDEQWLYLPEFRRTRQISARVKDESFVGSDFTYRDLEIVGKILRWRDAEAASKLVADETIGGRPCYGIELLPKQEGMPYKKILLALDRERLVPRKLAFFDGDGVNVKVLTTDDLRDIDAIPTPHRIEMRNLTKGSRTEVTIEEVKFNTGLADELFTQRQLERGTP